MRLPRSSGRSYCGEAIGWVPAKDLLHDRPLWVPWELVSADLTVSQPSWMGMFQATTNGLAAGNHWLEAVLHAIYEIVERDATALWRGMPEAAQDACALDPGVVEGRGPCRLLAAFAKAQVDVRLWDVTSDIGIPAFVCLAVSSAANSAVEPELGFGCHADRDVALTRAISEAAQARLTRISGARDDFDPDSYRAEARAARQEAARRWLAAPATGRFRAEAGHTGPTLLHDLDVVLAQLQAAGVQQVACTELSHADLDIPVVKVVVPGLEGPWTPSSGEYTAGHRARAVA